MEIYFFLHYCCGFCYKGAKGSKFALKTVNLIKRTCDFPSCHVWPQRAFPLGYVWEDRGIIQRLSNVVIVLWFSSKNSGSPSKRIFWTLFGLLHAKLSTCLFWTIDGFRHFKSSISVNYYFWKIVKICRRYEEFCLLSK